jgi:hypothetical protein
VDRVEAFGLALGQVLQPHGDDAEALLLDAGKDAADDAGLHGVGFDDRECTFH